MLRGRGEAVTPLGSSAGEITPPSDTALLPKRGEDELLMVGDVLPAVNETLSVTEDRVSVPLLGSELDPPPARRWSELPIRYEDAPSHGEGKCYRFTWTSVPPGGSSS